MTSNENKLIEGVSYDELAAQTGLSKANLYNIRKWALERLKKKARIALIDADALCAIRCEQYVLDMFGIHKPLFELKRLAEDKGWLTDTGVAIENLGKIPRQYGLTVRTYKSDLKKITAAVEAGKQVIVAVDGGGCESAEVPAVHSKFYNFRHLGIIFWANMCNFFVKIIPLYYN